MYWNVPRIVPATVRLEPCGVVGSIESPETTPAGGSESFASPKSRSFTPPLVNITLAGLRSRWTMPARCARSSASAIWIPYLTACSMGREPRPTRSRERLAFEELHDEVLDALLVTDVVERADVRVRELRDRLCFALETLARLGRGQVVGENLDRDSPLEPGVFCPVHLTHAARADRREDLVRAEPRSRGERHRASGARTAGSSSRSRSKPSRSQVTSVRTRAFTAQAAMRASYTAPPPIPASRQRRSVAR